MDREAGIVTPEAVPLELDSASIGSRGVAFLLDAAIVATLIFGLALAGAFLADAASNLLPPWLVLTIGVVTLFGVQFGYPIGFETLWHGRTPGKAALGLRVITVEGGPIGFRHAAVRAALGVVDFWLTMGSAAIIAALVTRHSQRLGDLAAGTLVLRERTGQGPPTTARFDPPPGREDYVRLLDVTGLRERDYGAVRSFLLRAPGLDPRARPALAGQLARPLAERVRPGAPDGLDAETFLRCVAAAYQARHRPRWPGHRRAPPPGAPLSPREAQPPPGAEVGEPPDTGFVAPP